MDQSNAMFLFSASHNFLPCCVLAGIEARPSMVALTLVPAAACRIAPVRNDMLLCVKSTRKGK